MLVFHLWVNFYYNRNKVRGSSVSHREQCPEECFHRRIEIAEDVRVIRRQDRVRPVQMLNPYNETFILEVCSFKKLLK
jgi:hypothetical protein